MTKLSFFFSLVFFIISFYTLKDYGISWDETIHFARGQAYLYYFLTGKTDYKDLPSANLQGTLGKPENYPVPRRSFYQLDDYHDGNYFIYKDVGHPPVNDILAAVSNYIFFQKLGVLDDITSYHLFNILASALLVFVVGSFALEVLGIFPGMVSVMVLSFYPLFWSESHFNIKDPVEAAFFAGTIWAYWKSVQKGSWLWLTLAFVFFGLALGTKFNALFVPIILALYFLVRYWNWLRKPLDVFRVVPRTYLIGLLFGPLIVLAIFVGAWPYLWHNFPVNFSNVIRFYQEIGVGTKFQPDSFYIGGFNTFPLQWIFFTTPAVTLVLSLIGIVVAWLYRKKYSGVPILWLLWFFVPIFRVTFPGTVIYGGVRQIMEYIPAMALLSGLGAKMIYDFVKHGWLKLCLTFLIFALLTYPIITYHPNENVYFNFLIGGLAGAKEKNFPSWGNSFGNAYLQGIDWLNEHAPQGAKLSLIQGTRLNVPPILVRKDIAVSPLNWSGIARDGEYLMDLTFNDTTQEFHYAWEYVNKFLVPVYEVKAGGVPILTIWKNDINNTKSEYRLFEKTYTGPVLINKEKNLLTVNMGNNLTLSKIIIDYAPKKECTPVSLAYMETSENGKNWLREKDWMPYPQVSMTANVYNNRVAFYLAGRRARMFRLVLDSSSSCVFDSPKIALKVLESPR